MTLSPRSLTAILAIGLTTLITADSSQAQTSLKKLTDRLPASITEDERAATVTDAVTSRVGEQLEGKSTEDLIRDAQNMLKRSKEGAPQATTITDTTVPSARATPAATTNQPLIPEPAANNSRAPVAPAAPAAAPAPQMVVAQATPTPPPVAAPGAVPAPIPLRPRYEDQKGNSGQVMEIESDESVMDNDNRLITFSGSVIVTEPRFTLTSDHLEVWMNDDTNLDGSPTSGASATDADAPPFKRAIATGGMVEIEKIGADGKVQIAKARKADYDAATGDIVLSGGPPTLQSGTGFVNPSSPDATIILRADGNHQINGGTGGRNKISIPLKGGAAKTGGGPLSGSLDSITGGDR